MKKEAILTTRRYGAPCGELLLGSVGGELCLCDWTGSRRHEANVRRLTAVFGARPVEGSSAVIEETAAQLDEYFAGTRREFELPLRPAGTAFQLAVWQALMNVSYGTTATYGDIARVIGRPEAVRAVAAAIGANPLSIVVPCHRIIGRDGSLTGYAGGLPAKRALLALEQPSAALNR